MKPFIKPRPATSPAVAPPAQATPTVTPGELSISSLAAAIAEPTERAAYLDRACRGDAALRARIEERLSAKSAQPAAQSESLAVIRPQQIAPHAGGGHAVALVPMTAAQLTAATAPAVRPNTVPWLAATLLATAAGALAVLFSIEKTNRANAELAAIEAQGETAAARQQRLEAEATALESKTAAERSEQRAQQQRDAALATAENEKAARLTAETERTKADERTKAAETAAAAAAREKTAATTNQRATTAALADALTALAAAQLNGRNYADASKSASQALELRIALGTSGWPLIDAHLTLGSALFQTNQDAAAEREYTAAAAAIEALGQPADTDRIRFADATKRVLRFFGVTGRRKEGADWKAKFDALAKPTIP